MSNKGLSKELINKIIELSKQGLINQEIADKLGMSKLTVNKYSLNTKKVLNKKDIAKMHKMYYDFKAIKDIASLMDLSIHTVYRHLKGLPKRTKNTLTSTPKPLPPKKRKTEVRKQDDESMRRFKTVDPVKDRVKVEIKPGLWAYIKNDERFEERLERIEELFIKII